jgi:hypothetical protein
MEGTYKPIDVNSLSSFVDMRGLRDYAKAKGVAISELSNAEKEKFLKPNQLPKAVVNQ